MSYLDDGEPRRPVCSLEVSKSGRAACKFTKCKLPIAKGIPRWVHMVDAPAGMGDGGQVARCYHIACGLQVTMFKKLFRSKDEVDDACGDIPGFDTLPRDDQDYVCDMAEEAFGGDKALPYWQTRQADAEPAKGKVKVKAKVSARVARSNTAANRAAHIV